MSDEVKAWETDDSAVVWGTHDRKIARAEHHHYLTAECGLDPERDGYGGERGLTEIWQNAAAMYGDPAALEIERGWTEKECGPNPVDGWVPYLVAVL